MPYCRIVPGCLMHLQPPFRKRGKTREHSWNPVLISSHNLPPVEANKGRRKLRGTHPRPRQEASPPASPIYDWMSVFFTLTLLCTSMVYSSRKTKVSSGYLNVMICSNIAIHVVLQCASMYCSDYFFYVILERFMRRTSSFNCMLASEKHINRRTSCAFS